MVAIIPPPIDFLKQTSMGGFLSPPQSSRPSFLVAFPAFPCYDNKYETVGKHQKGALFYETIRYGCIALAIAIHSTLS